MESDPKIAKSLSRIERELHDLSEAVEGKLSEKEMERLSSMLSDDPVLLNFLVLDDSAANDLTSLFAGKKSSLAQVQNLKARIEQTAAGNGFVSFLDMCIALKEERYEDLVSIAKTAFGEKPSGSPLRLLLANAEKIPDKFFLSNVFSISNIYEYNTLSAFLEGKPDTAQTMQISGNFIKNGNRKAAIEFLFAATSKNHEPFLAIDLARMLLKEGKTSEAQSAINRLDFDELEDKNYLADYIGILLETGDLKMALRAVNHASYLFKDDPGFIILHSRCLRKMDRSSEALELIDQSTAFRKDQALAFERAEVLLELGRYQEYVDTIKMAYPQGIPEGSAKVQYIDVLVRLSLFDDALKEISASLSIDPKNLQVLRKKFQVQNLLNNYSEAYQTAELIISIDPRDKDSALFILGQLFRSANYENLISKYSVMKTSDLSGVENLLVASMVYTGDFAGALAHIVEKPSLLSSPEVIDSIFFSIREEEQLQKLMDIAGTSSRLALMTLYKIKGKYIMIDDALWDMIRQTKSEAVVWTAVSVSANFRNRTKPELLASLLASKAFANVSNLVDAIGLVYAGKYTEEMSDSRKFMYPLSQALIDIREIKAASSLLEASRDPKKSDPFYHYLLSRIQVQEGDIGSARKSIMRALGRLTNRDFLTHAIRVAIIEGDSDTVLLMLDRIIEMKEQDYVDLSQLYKYLSDSGLAELQNKIVERFDRVGSRNLWIERMRRDRYMRENEIVEAEKVSRKIVVSKSKLVDDIKKHAELLQSAKKDQERIEFLQEEQGNVQDPQIDLWLGDYYIINKNFEKAIESYRKAEARGMKESDIKNLPEALIEVGEYEAAEKLLKSGQGNEVSLIKLYHRTGRIQEVVDLLKRVNVKNKEEEAAILYISRILWVNRQIRDTMIQLFHESHSLFLGKIISQRLLESRDFIGAERVMREILKKYPGDVENLRSLGDLLVEINHPSEAVSILMKGMKYIETKNDMQDIVNRICRIYYETGEYNLLTEFFRKNPQILDSTNIHWIIRSYIETGDFDTADRLAGQYHGALLKEDSFRELIDEMNLKKEFLSILGYAAQVFRVEYKIGKVLTSEEMVYTAGIPLDAVERVIQLIGSDEYYRAADERLYEMVSKDVIQRAVKKSTVETINDLKIFVIFNNLPKRDVILSKNVYSYIRKCISQKRDPMLNDPASNTLLRSAIKLGLRPEPLDVAYNLNLGISDAMDIIALMEYVAKLNS